MSRDLPEKIWWTAAEIAAATLPDLPTTKRKVNERAAREGWAKQPDKFRRRRGKGGGLEYHFSLFPVRARTQLLRQLEPTGTTVEKRSADQAWADYEAQSETNKKKAEGRHQALSAIAQLQAAGLTRTLAVREVSKVHDASEKTLWNWLEMVEGIAEADWLAYLAPRKGQGRKAKVVLDADFVALIKSDWLRNSAPSLTSCYDRAVRVAKREDMEVASLQAVRRHLKATVSKPTEVFWRKGAEALKRLYPHQDRDKSALVPLECVCGDYHKFDVFIQWPGEDAPVRVQMVAFSDVYSGKLLSWRLSLTANSHTVQLCLGDLIRTYGIPQGALLDNGREFAAKTITGGTETRFRFKIRDDDVPGLLPLMGVKVHWATPYSGQSKPIERTFRDLCDRVAKHPAFEGAYTGNRPDAKPENYGNRAIPLDEFKAVLAEEIDHHNARADRRSEVANGRSFNEVFNAGYERAPIRKATDEQLRMWLLAAEGVRAKTGNGEVKVYGNRYWSEWMYRIAEKRVIARFDPDRLHQSVFIYDLTGEYIGEAAAIAKGGFTSVEDAKDIARKRSQFVRAAKEAARAEKVLSDSEIADRLRASGEDVQPDNLPEAQIVQLPTPHKNAPKQAKPKPAPVSQEVAPVASLADRRKAKEPGWDGSSPEARFERAMVLEEALSAGEAVSEQQQSWLKEYQTSAEYGAHKKMREAFGGHNKG